MSGASAKRADMERADMEEGATDLQVFGTVWPETTPTLGITPVLPDEVVLVLARAALGRTVSLEPGVADRKTAPGADTQE